MDFGDLGRVLDQRSGLILAAIALLLPLVREWLKGHAPSRVDIHEAGVLGLTYGPAGPTIGMRGTVRAVNRDVFVREMELNLRRLKDGAEHQLQWSSLYPLGTTGG